MVLDNHVALKTEQLRFNHSPFTAKALQKAVITRSRLKNIHNKKQSYDNSDKSKKQISFYIELLRKTKQDNFNNINKKMSTILKNSVRRLNLILVRIELQ